MFRAGDEVLIVACEDDPRAVGKTGRVLDEVPPGPLTGGRWTVDRISLFVAPVLVHTHEIRKVSG
ncbi:hypothetical protein [Streptomyces ficellus]|uniref:KOW domain-containing protein n=1 Tax=Streptomyces ficellus TaxID=1977088 RepID=A0A6I6F9L5_9ACTN|nr:hypothetical protein [Streptomyces ficellus]QGV79781.1 hypothetical protein EIZ62_17205 [Streptomyces ficellus]